MSSMIENRSSGIDERSIRVFSELFAYAIYMFSAHMYIRSYYTIKEYDSVTNKLSASNMMIMMMKLQRIITCNCFHC